MPLLFPAGRQGGERVMPPPAECRPPAHSQGVRGAGSPIPPCFPSLPSPLFPLSFSPFSLFPHFPVPSLPSLRLLLFHREHFPAVFLSHRALRVRPGGVPPRARPPVSSPFGPPPPRPQQGPGGYASPSRRGCGLLSSPCFKERAQTAAGISCKHGAVHPRAGFISLDPSVYP